MHNPTAGTDAAASVATLRWQKVQSMPSSWTWTVWGKAMGWSGPSLSPKASSGKPSHAERTKEPTATRMTKPTRPLRPMKPNASTDFLFRLGRRKSPGSKSNVP